MKITVEDNGQESDSRDVVWIEEIQHRETAKFIFRMIAKTFGGDPGRPYGIWNGYSGPWKIFYDEKNVVDGIKKILNKDEEILNADL